MDSPGNIQGTVYELPLPYEPSAEGQTGGWEQPLPAPLLVQNALWFCRFRWLVIVTLVGYGALGLFPGLIARSGIRSPGTWPFAIAGVLTLSNCAFLLLARTKTSPTRVISNLWGQIITDLVILTIVVYFWGSLETNIAFAYLFHIVLSCVFFSRRQSLIVTTLAVSMFTVCAGAEHVLKILPSMSVFAGSPLEQSGRAAPVTLTVNFLLTVGMWVVVWYLASHLSFIVRQRDFELAETNRRLMAAQQERSRHMLVTTHQLKAPFAAIHSNTQLLLAGYYGDIPDEAVEVIRRIMARCRRLTAEIQEMLQLANLSSVSQEPPPKTKMVSTELLLWCISQVDPMAQERGVVFNTDLQPVTLMGSEDHFKMLFVNLLLNAVVYSHRNGRVHVSCRQGAGLEPVVTIADNGIGIASDKIPHIFDEYYRTEEAVRHNKESSGLGLSIVRRIAEIYRIRIKVESHPGSGTKFELTFPTVADSLTK